MQENEKFPLSIQNEIIDNVMKLSQTLLASKLIPDKRNHSQGFQTQASVQRAASETANKTKIHHRGF
jgi:hypothetical protein